MRLEGWHIDGYGHFADMHTRELAPGLTVFHGPNEAGKSTLLSFIQNMLFGFPRTNARHGTLIPALAGGRHGGRLIVVGDERDGSWTIERHRDPNALTVTGPEGEIGSEADIERLLHQVERNLFESVFAFSLRELEQLGGLDDEELQRQLFAAGLTGVGQSAEGALAALSAQADTLYRQRSASELKDAYRRLNELRGEQHEAREAIDRYTALRERESELEDELQAARSHQEALNAEDQRLKRLHDLWAIENRRVGDAAQLAKLSGTPEVTPGQLAQVRELAQRLVVDEERLTEAVDEREEVERRLSMSSVDDALLQAAEAVKAVAVDLPLQRQRTNDRVAARQSVKIAERTLTESLAQLGPSWNADRVKQFDASLPRRTEVAAWMRDMTHAQVVTEDAERVRRTCATTQVAAERTLAEAEDALAGVTPPLGEAAIDAVLADVARLKAARMDSEAARRDLEAANDRLASLRDNQPTSSKAHGTQAVPATMLYAIGAFAVVCGLALAAVGEALGGAVSFGLGVVVLLVGFLAGRASRAAADGAADAADRVAGHAQRVAEAEARIAQLREAMHAAQVRAAELGRSAELTEDASSEDIEARVLWLQRERERLTRFTELERAAMRAREDCERCLTETGDADREIANAHAQVEDRASGWAAWCQEHGLTEEIGPEIAGPLLEEAGRAHAHVTQLEEAERALAENERAIDAWDKAADAAIDAAGRPAATASELIGAIAQLARDIETTIAADTERRQLQRSLDETKTKQHAAQERRDNREQQLELLLNEAGADDVAALEQLALTTDERRLLQTELVGYDSQMREVAGIGAESDALLEEARSGRVEEWERRSVEISTERSTIAEAIDALVGERARSSDKRAQLEHSSDLARIGTEIEQVSAEAADALRRFRVVKTAEWLIHDTLERFIRERQPAVLKAASDWFAQVTDHRYLKIRQARGEHDLAIEASSGTQLRVAQLSRGTKEQLYLCLRLALAQDFAARGSALPLVMDDVLVNFSPDRAAAMAEILVAASQTQQILIFTCHPTTRDLLINAGEKLGFPVEEEELHRDEKPALANT